MQVRMQYKVHGVTLNKRYTMIQTENETENTFPCGDNREYSSITIFQKALLTLNYEKYYLDPSKTYKLNYPNYIKKNKGPLPMDFPVPDYSHLIQTSTWK